MLKFNDKNKFLHVEDVLLLLLTYKRYSGSICDEQSGLNVRPHGSLPSLLAHFQSVRTDRQTDTHKLKVALLTTVIKSSWTVLLIFNIHKCRHTVNIIRILSNSQCKEHKG